MSKTTYTDQNIDKKILWDAIAKAGIPLSPPPEGRCPANYFFSTDYCGRKLYKGSEYCYWHTPSKDKYSSEEISCYFGENITIKEAIEKEVAERHPLGLAYLVEANIGGNSFKLGCNLRGGNFVQANLSGAGLSYSDLEQTDFRLANLEHAYLSACNMKGTNFAGAKLFNTKFRNSNFDAVLGLKKDSFKGLKWGWFPKYQMYEEYPDQCEEMYRRLASHFTAEGLLDDASWAAYRSAILRHRLLRKKLSLATLTSSMWSEEFLNAPNTVPRLSLIKIAATWVTAFAAWCRSLFLRIIMGYGEKPSRVLANAMFVILGYAMIYFRLGAINDKTFLGSLYFSVITFTTLGYGDVIPIGPFRLLAATEAMFGLFLTGMFLFLPWSAIHRTNLILQVLFGALRV